MTDAASDSLLAGLEAVIAAAQASPKSHGPLAEEARRHLVLHSRPVRIAVAGEYSSGKSTLVNLMAGARMVDTSILPTELPPILFSYAPQGQVLCGWWGEPDRIAKSESDLAAMAQGQYDFLYVTTPTMTLRSIELVDLPGLNDPGRDDSATMQLAQRADGLIWCTNAVNAWRETERRRSAELSHCKSGRAILVVTHVDLAAVRQAVPRLMRRVKTEAGAMFRAILPVATPKATAVQTALGTITDNHVWEESGAKALFDAITALVAELEATHVTDTLAFLDTDAVQALLATGAAPAVARPDELMSQWRTHMHNLSRRAPALEAEDLATLATAALRDLGDMMGRLSPAHGQAAAWLHEELAIVVGLIDPADPARIAALLRQINRDLVQVIGRLDG
jgi:ethanolamine utilization protein EutP (predicted NTPase)